MPVATATKRKTRRRGGSTGEAEIQSAPPAATKQGGGDIEVETDCRRAAPVHKSQMSGGPVLETEVVHAAICDQLQALQRVRVSFLKSRIMLNNRLVSSVAVALGYRSGLEEVDRKAAWDAARKAIKGIVGGERDSETEGALAPLVQEAMRSINGFDKYVKLTEKRMVKLAAKLPVAGWVAAPEQRGFGLQSLAILVGECGDLANYANPGKLWRRMGCAPFESDGKTKMGATWKSKGGLSAAEWESFGYCPRRRSIAFVFGENLLKLNFVGGGAGTETDRSIAPDDSDNEAVGDGDDVGETENPVAGPYRLRYDTVKAAKLALESSDWPKLRCHRHAMLLATKRLIRELWKQWNPGMVRDQEW